MATATTWAIPLLTAKATATHKVKIRWKRSNPQNGQIKIVLNPPVPYKKVTLLNEPITKGSNVSTTKTFTTTQQIMDGSDVTCELSDNSKKVMARALAQVEV